MVEDEDEYIVLSVNLEEMDALGLPDRTFIDVNHYPEAMEFLVKNGLATDSEYVLPDNAGGNGAGCRGMRLTGSVQRRR